MKTMSKFIQNSSFNSLIANQKQCICNTMFIVALIASLLSISGFSNAQDCKFTKEEVDPFSNGRVLHSKVIPMLPAMSDSRHDLTVQRNGDDYAIYLYTQVTSAERLNFQIQEGQKMMFLLDNKDTVVLSANSTVFGKEPQANQGWTGSVFSTTIFNTYSINKAQLDKFIASPIQLIRFYIIDSNNREIKIDRKKIPDGAKVNFQQAIKCVTLN